jgi:L-threonylcarbamoyladenylate synthase
MQTQIVSARSAQALEQAAALLHAGGLVAFPTDTVYGLGAALFNVQAIEQLYIVKGRDAAKAIAVLVGDESALGQVAGVLSGVAARLARRFWPGPLTLVVAAHPSLPASLSPLPTVGVRMPDHPVALALLRHTGPLAVTSANLSGEPSATTAEEVYAQLKGRIPFILDGGQTPGGRPSTVVDCTGRELVILRQGPISLQLLLEVAQSENQTAPD